MWQDTLKQLLSQTVQNLYGEVPNFSVEHPREEKFGDYATNVALLLAPIAKKAPLQIAQEIADALPASSAVKSIEVVPPGFINFWLSEELLLQELTLIAAQGDEYGQSQVGQNQSVIVEYSSPNIAKPFTIGHLRSTIIGDAVANLLEASGWKVFRDNHLGDWGTQFGKQIYAIKTWGDESEIEKAAEPVKKLVELYVKFHEEAEKDPVEDEGRAWFKRLEDGDEEARRLWQKCIDWSWKEFSRLYELMNVSFTENGGLGYGESYFEDKMEPIIEELKEKGLLKESEGAWLFFFPNDEFPPLMILKKDGSTLYATRDLATDKFRLQKYGENVRIINEVGAEQSLYFQQLYRVEELLGWVKPGQRVHVKHGMFRFADKKMSTRKGNVIWLETVLNEAIERAKQLSETMTPEVAQQIGIGAVKWNDLKRSSHLDVVFDWDEILSMQGNSGPYVQYTHARGRSVVSKAREALQTMPDAAGYQPNEAERALLRWLYRFGEVVEDAAKNFTPNTLTTYLYELAQRYNAFYNAHSVMQADSDAAKAFRIQLTEASTQVLKNGLTLLGITAPEKV
jgi:arginyl-tRNA synthetase